MLFAMILTDGPDAQVLRTTHLESHLNFVLGTLDHIRVAGPLMDGATGRPGMSLYVIEADDEAAAHGFLQQDPYYRAGVWSGIEIRPFVAAAGTWVGGAAWLNR